MSISSPVRVWIYLRYLGFGDYYMACAAPLKGHFNVQVEHQAAKSQ